MPIASQIFIFFLQWSLVSGVYMQQQLEDDGDFKLPQEIFDLAATTILCSAMAQWEISTHFFSKSY